MRYAPSIVVNLERTAQQFPDRCAIQQGEHAVRYGDLWQHACSVAGYLREHGLQAGDRVALLLDNSAEFVAALYGTMLAGGVAVALNTAARAREFAAWLSHSGARWVITEPDRADAAAAILELPDRPRIVFAGRPDAALPLAPATTLAEVFSAALPFVPRTSFGDADPACIIYTSGTTGSPKGVVLGHRNLASNTEAIVQYLQLRSEDSILSILPFYYSYGSSVLHTHLRVGGRIVLESNLVYPHLVVANLAKEKVTGFAGVPSTYALLLNRVDLGQHDLGALRYLTQAGGAMSPALTQRLRAALPAAELFVMYGQTEATARLTYLPPAMLERKLGSVGIPIAGVEIQIRREDGSLAAAEEDGEVWVRGPNVMQGYWRDSDATRSVLRDGWLKTGDMGHRDGDGYLYLSGRRGDMIKTGAHRVHPKDVEEVIQEIEQVAEVAVVGVDDEVLGQAVAAFIVPTADAKLDLLAVKTHCRNRLATYKIPKSIEFVGALPKTASGKVRRHELVQRKYT